MIDRDAYEDYLAATNPRLQKKVAAARAEIAAGDTVTLEDLMNK
jgi:PHD/YefM family antitoxin component YafN of YafNO toxin-antitoxin module